MKLKIWQWVLLGLAAYLVFLIKLMPASWLLGSGLVKLPANVNINSPSGTVWAGSSSAVSVDGISVQQLSWDLSFWNLLRGKLSVDLLAGQLRGSENVYLKGNLATFLYNFKALELNNFTALVPAQSILSQVDLPIPVIASGRFKADIQYLEYKQACQELQGSGGWNNGRVNGLSGPIEFGSFSALLNCENEDIKVAIQPNNILSLEATVTVAKNGTYRVLGRFNIPPELPEEVQQAAEFFGSPDSQGFRKIDETL